MNKANMQFTKVATAQMPVEVIVKKGVLDETVDALLAFLRQRAVGILADQLDELFGTHWGGPISVKVASHSHNVFCVAGVATISVLATFEEDK